MLIRYSSIQKQYLSICEKLKRRCKYSTKIPRLIKIDKYGKKSYTIQGLSLVFFGMNINIIKSKLELISFLRSHGCKTNDPQPRHFGMQYGFDFMVMGSYHSQKRRILKAGEYCLKSLITSHPKGCARSHRVSQVTNLSFMHLKNKYCNRCAHCGSYEHESNLKNPKVITKLEKSHMDPTKQLTIGNCIPLCNICNHVYKNNVIFNRNGFVKSMYKKRR